MPQQLHTPSLQPQHQWPRTAAHPVLTAVGFDHVCSFCCISTTLELRYCAVIQSKDKIRMWTNAQLSELGFASIETARVQLACPRQSQVWHFHYGSSVRWFIVPDFSACICVLCMDLATNSINCLYSITEAAYVYWAARAEYLYTTQVVRYMPWSPGFDLWWKKWHSDICCNEIPKINIQAINCKTHYEVTSSCSAHWIRPAYLRRRH